MCVVIFCRNQLKLKLAQPRENAVEVVHFIERILHGLLSPHKLVEAVDGLLRLLQAVEGLLRVVEVVEGLLRLLVPVEGLHRVVGAVEAVEAVHLIVDAGT